MIIGTSKGFIRGKALSTEGHTHTIAQVTNLQTTLNGKANSSHTHSTSQISGLQNYVLNLIGSSGGGVDIRYYIGTGTGPSGISDRKRYPRTISLGYQPKVIIVSNQLNEFADDDGGDYKAMAAIATKEVPATLRTVVMLQITSSGFTAYSFYVDSNGQGAYMDREGEKYMYIAFR